MSLLSSDVSIVARAGAAASGKTQIDELYAKLTVAAAVIFISLEIAYLVMAGLPPVGKSWFDKPSRGSTSQVVVRQAKSWFDKPSRGSTSHGWTARISSSAATSSISGWAAARYSATVRRLVGPRGGGKEPRDDPRNGPRNGPRNDP
jgi:hypothetical protein